MIDPIQLFQQYFDEAVAAGQTEADAMALASVDSEGRPSVRVVLFKGIIDGGVSFFTNYDSRKCQDLDRNPRVSTVFYWTQTTRQIRIEGTVKKLATVHSDEYWQTRPRDSQLSGSVSPQSREIASLQDLRDRARQLERELEGKPIPRPANWGGYAIVPEIIEFWKAGDFRLHERIVYRRAPDGSWSQARLAP